MYAIVMMSQISRQEFFHVISYVNIYSFQAFLAISFTNLLMTWLIIELIIFILYLTFCFCNFYHELFFKIQMASSPAVQSPMMVTVQMQQAASPMMHSPMMQTVQQPGTPPVTPQMMSNPSGPPQGYPVPTILPPPH